MSVRIEAGLGDPAGSGKLVPGDALLVVPAGRPGERSVIEDLSISSVERLLPRN
jgi:hypothetical protein